MLQKEEKSVQVLNLFDLQPELTAEMRYILLDWLNQVSSDYCLKRATFHKSIQMVDNYLLSCKRKVPVCEF